MPDFYSQYSNDDEVEIFEAEPEDFHELDSIEVPEDILDSHDDGDDVEVSEGDDALVGFDELMYELNKSSDDEDRILIPGTDVEIMVVEDDDEEELKENDWENDKDPKQFVMYLGDKLKKIPRHSGKTIPGCERAMYYIKSLDNEASHAMRRDFNGDIDEVSLEELRQQMKDMVYRLENHIDELQKTAGQQKVRLHANGDSGGIVQVNASVDGGLEKTAGLPVMQVFMTPFERAIVGTIINAKVSGGRNMEDVYDNLKNKYNFSPREELSIQQLIYDHGYPVWKDRGRLNEPTDPASGDNVEWQTNYHA